MDKTLDKFLKSVSTPNLSGSDGIILQDNSKEEVIVTSSELAGLSTTPQFKEGDTVKIVAKSNTHGFKVGTEVTVTGVFTKPYKGFEYYYMIESVGLSFFVTPDIIGEL